MINAYFNDGGWLRIAAPSPANLAEPVWLDLVEPTSDEEQLESRV